MFFQKGFTPILIVILVAIALSGYVLYQKQTKPIPPIKACTQDSKVCSDGSYVSRIPPNCDFAPCPSPKESTSSAVYPAPTGAGDISTWKTYNNTEYSFKYPNNFTVRERSNIYSRMTGKQTMALSIQNNNPSVGTYLEILSESNTLRITSEQYFNNFLEGLTYPEAKTMATTLKETLKPYSNGEIQGTYALLSGDHDWKTIVQTRDNRVYTFIYESSNEEEKVINQILSTFRFD